MFCPSCGERTIQGLSYCKHCGAELSSNERNLKRGGQLPPAFLVAAMVGTFVFGTGVITGLIAVMRASSLNEGFINACVVMSFLLMLTLEAIFTRLLLRATFGSRETGERALTQRSTNELDTPQPPMLAASPMSVTEHTTRTLEPVDNKKATRKQ